MLRLLVYMVQDVVHIFLSLVSGVLLMGGYYPNDNPLERNNPKKRMYKRTIAGSSLAMAFLGIVQLFHGVNNSSVRSITAPTLLVYHMLQNLIQWNGSASSSMSAMISPHLFLGLCFSMLVVEQL